MAATNPPRPTAHQARFAALDKHWFSMLKDLTVWGYYTSEVGQVEELGIVPVPAGSYEGCAPRQPHRRALDLRQLP